MIRVLVAEDSPTVRALLVAILEGDPALRVIGQAADGAQAVEMAVRLRPDVITMDIHMPVLDGLKATKEIMRRAPTPIVIVSSTVNRLDVSLSLEATRAGALIVLPKPKASTEASSEGARAELVSMVRAMSGVKVVRHRGESSREPHASAVLPPPRGDARLVAIAASTGGPAALRSILTALPADFGAPILIVQHMSPGFVGGLADWLDGSCRLRVKLAVDGEPIRRGCVYLAPDDRHLGISSAARIRLSAEPPDGGFRPSANSLFRSVASSEGAAGCAVILTGMGRDGVDGAVLVKQAGGRVIAQDAATSIVYGMPREAVAAGIADAVLSLDAIAQALTRSVIRGDDDQAYPDR